MADYKVTAGFVTVTTAVDGGRARVDIARGASLPSDVPDAEVAALLTLGHVEPAEEAAAAKPEAPVRKTRKTGS